MIFGIAASDQSATRTLAEEGAAPAWSPDGLKIAFCSDEVLPTIESIELFRTFGHIGGLEVKLLQGLIVRSSWFSSIAVIDRSQRKKVIVAAKPGHGVCEPTWSPNGKQVAYTDYDRHSKRSDIYIVGSDGSDSHLVTEGYRPQWSPDGRQLTFFRARKGPGTKSSVWVVNTDGSGLQRLTDDKSISWTPTWTADGKILFASNREGPSAIYVVTADGGDLKRIASPKEFGLKGGIYVPRPSPDGRQLLVDNYDFQGDETLLLELDGSHRIKGLNVPASGCRDWLPCTDWRDPSGQVHGRLGLDVAVRWEPK